MGLFGKFILFLKEQAIPLIFFRVAIPLNEEITIPIRMTIPRHIVQSNKRTNVHMK